MKKLISVFIILFSFSFSFGNDIHKAVIDLRTGDIDRFENGVLKGLSYVIQGYRDRLEDMKVVVVAHGESYKFFLKDLSKTPYRNDKKLLEKQKEIKERLENLVKFYGVKFEICKAGMIARKLDLGNLYPFVKPIPTALNGIVEWQEKGYKYMIFE